MTTAEALKILGVIKLAYPNAWKDIDQKKQAGLWAMLFSDEETHIVQAAVKEYLLSDAEFPPSPGQISNIIQSKKPKPIPLFPSADEAWRMVSEAARNAGYYSEREFACLPAVVQKALGKPLNLKEISQMDTAKDIPFEGNRFRQRYQAIIDNPDLPRQLEEAAKDNYIAMRQSDSDDFLPEEQIQALIRKANEHERRMAGRAVLPLPKEA